MIRFLTVVVVVLALGGLFLFGLLRGRPDRDITSNILNKPVPSFELPLFEPYKAEYGDEFKLEEHMTKPMLVNFWASWCIPCYEEAPELEAAWQKYQDDVLFIGIQTQDKGKGQEGLEFIEQFNLSFPNVRDDSSRVSISYGLFGVPETFFVDSGGTLVYKHVGPVTAAVLNEQLEALIE